MAHPIAVMRFLYLVHPRALHGRIVRVDGAHDFLILVRSRCNSSTIRTGRLTAHRAYGQFRDWGVILGKLRIGYFAGRGASAALRSARSRHLYGVLGREPRALRTVGPSGLQRTLSLRPPLSDTG